MKINISIPTMTLCAASLVACGPDLAESSSQSEQGLSASFAEEADFQNAEFRMAEDRVSAGLQLQRPSPRGYRGQEPRPVLTEWKREAMTLRDLSDELFLYREMVQGQASQLYKVRFIGGLLVKREVFNEQFQLWAPVTGEVQVAQPEPLQAPISLRSAERNIVVELEDCTFFPQELFYACDVSSLAKVSVYTPQILEAGKPAPSTLACLENCPMPVANVQQRFFGVDEDAFMQEVLARVVKYDYNSQDMRLTHEGQEISAPGGADGQLHSGFMFEYTDENVDGMGCDLDRDGKAEESCAWQSLDTFYTFGTDYSLPPRGLVAR